MNEEYSQYSKVYGKITKKHTGIIIFSKQIGNVLLSMNWCWKFLSTQKSKFPRRKDLCWRLCWKLVCIGNSDYQSSYSMERKRKKLLQNRKKFLMDDNSQAKLNCIKCAYREASITFKIQIYSLPGSKNSKSLNVNYSLTKLIFVSVTGFFSWELILIQDFERSLTNHKLALVTKSGVNVWMWQFFTNLSETTYSSPVFTFSDKKVGHYLLFSNFCM